MPRTSCRTAVCLFLTLAGCASERDAGRSRPRDPAPASAAAGAADVETRITVDAIAGPLAFLADDLFEGRGPGSRGDALARAYLAAEFRAAGLAPGGVGGSYEQPTPIVGMTATLVEPLSVAGPNGAETFQAPDDYVVFPWTESPTLAWDKAETVFVGYGITAPEQNWDDFKDVDVRGKVVVVMNDDPSSDPSLFAGKTRLYYGRWTYKFEEAARRGAIGALLIHTTPSASYPFQVIQSNHGQERFNLPSAERSGLRIAAWISEEAARKLAAAGGKDLDALRRDAESRAFRPTPLGVTASVRAANKVRTFESGNVVGVLRGSDPKLRDEYVAVTAHFDHLGRGPAKGGDEIYNGALDNASGTAAMLALARAWTAGGARPKRSVLFLGVTAEESGLLGSEHYARNPTVPIKAIVANFNIDGVNIWGRTRDVALVGHGKSSLVDVVERAAARQGRRIVPDPEPEKGTFYRSDHFSFARVGVPSVYLKAGRDFVDDAETRRSIQMSYTALHYHQPSNAFDARWNLEGAVEDLKLMSLALRDVADAPAPPRWTPGDEFEKLR